ncbi:MAG: hypothetical protein AB1633_04850 [Elusimicrobiota bacterium]
MNARKIFQITFFLLLGALTFIKLIGSVDPDLFWHLKNGEVLLKQGTFPVKDDYSFTARGKPLIANAWLSEVISYVIFNITGYAGLAVLHTLLLTVCYYLLFSTLSKTPVPFAWKFILTTLWFLNCLVFIAPRTQNIGLLLFIICLYLALKWEAGDKPRPFIKGMGNCLKLFNQEGRGKKTIWSIALIIPLWNNLHSGFAMGLMILALVVVGEIIENKKITLHTLTPLLVAILLSGVHPSGYGSLFHPFWMIFLSPEAKNIIKEWNPINISMTEISIPYFLLILSIMLIGLQNLKSRFPWLILILLLMLLSLRMQRMIPYFAAAGVIVLSKQISRLDLGKTSRFIRYGFTIFVLIFLYSYFFPNVFNVFPWDPENFDNAYPSAGVKFIKEKLPGKNIFSTYDWGGYLIFHLYPGNRIAFDGRSDLYYDLLDEYAHIIQSAPDTDKILARLNVDAVIVPTDLRLAFNLYNNPGWRMVFHKPKESIFVRKFSLEFH